MNAFKRISTITGWTVFAIATIVYFFSAERTGSLWDCGEFILGAYKLQVVHPPGAPLFLLIGRMFTWVADLFSDNPEDIAFAMNFMSGLLTAMAAAFGAWVTMAMGRIAMVGRTGETDTGQNIALAGAGLSAGLAIAFCTSIWFSAVEGEVYAMSLFFMAMTLWASVRWYVLPDEPKSDRWLLFVVYCVGLSIGVHLLSMLVLPAVALLYYFKKYPKPTFQGMAISAVIGAVAIGIIQFFVITGIPKLWAAFDIFAVNSLGLPFNSGLIFVFLIIAGILGYGFYYAYKNQDGLILNVVIAAFLLVTAYSSYGVVVIRANSSPPINMNKPDDPTRLLPYLTREQYGGRDLMRGPHFEGQVASVEYTDRMGRVGDRYEVVDEKPSYTYNSSDKMFFPRLSDPSQGRPRIYKMWMGINQQQPLPPGRPNQIDNIKFLWQYQLNWMYWRYFFWNFSGRQNGEQGYYPWDKSRGHWITGINFLDEMKLGNQSQLTKEMRDHEARNVYFMLPFLFGLLGLIYQIKKGRKEMWALLAFFVITGIGLIIYANPPPNEPRERDYVFAGSFFVYCFWIGMGVLALYDVFKERVKLSGPIAGGLAAALVLIAPLLMGFQNFDDHSRIHHEGARDYASNFLNSVDENAIIFTYGDNDTYPLWYAQEVEGIRRDVRVVNLSLIAVDWYIDLLRRKINDSPPINLSVSSAAMQGGKRNQVLLNKTTGPMTLAQYMQFIAEDHPLPLQGGRMTETYLPTDDVFLPVNKQEILSKGILPAKDSANIVSRIPIKLQGKQYLTKDDIAVLDIINSNLWDRPIYFAVTTRVEKMLGFENYCQLEGLALRLVPVQSPGERQFGAMLGAGRVNTEKVLENVQTKFKWGNFDERELFVDRSYGPSVQSMQFMMVRTGEALNREGKQEQAVALGDQYFEAFPNFNFPYDYQTAYMLDVYIRAGAYEKAKPHLDILANNILDELEFYGSLSPQVLQSSYAQQQRYAQTTASSLLSFAQQADDQESLQRYQALFGSYLAPAPTAPTQQPLKD
ncbi:MAG: DUF2723 domain-containing protein [Saprospiraceae bacterium]